MDVRAGSYCANRYCAVSIHPQKYRLRITRDNKQVKLFEINHLKIVFILSAEDDSIFKSSFI